MPNPRLSFRIPEAILSQLPANPEERSQFCLEAIYEKLNPPAPTGELRDIAERIESLENTMDKVFEVIELFEKKLARSKPSDLDEAINQALLRIRPGERKQAQRLFNQLRS